uniref:Uncharacterized protein n=1 Tax=Rhizophora mucronata TaxID=61149 RepID=A0A2P2Q7G4_RHIMU
MAILDSLDTFYKCMEKCYILSDNILFMACIVNLL